jgi:hypothetical protein
MAETRWIPTPLTGTPSSNSPWHESKYGNLFAFLTEKRDKLQRCFCGQGSMPFVVFTTSGQYDITCVSEVTCLDIVQQIRNQGSGAVVTNKTDNVTFRLSENPHVDAALCEVVKDLQPPPAVYSPLSVPLLPVQMASYGQQPPGASPGLTSAALSLNPEAHSIQAALNPVVHEKLCQSLFKFKVFGNQTPSASDPVIQSVRQNLAQLAPLMAVNYQDTSTAPTSEAGVVELDARSKDYLYLCWLMLYLAASVTFDILSFFFYWEASASGTQVIKEQPDIQRILDNIDLLVSLRFLATDRNTLKYNLSMLHNEYKSFGAMDAVTVKRRGNAGAYRAISQDRQNAKMAGLAGGALNSVSRKLSSAKFYLGEQYSARRETQFSRRVRPPSLQALLAVGKELYRKAIFKLRTLNRTFANNLRIQRNNMSFTAKYLRSDVHLIHTSFSGPWGTSKLTILGCTRSACSRVLSTH